MQNGNVMNSIKNMFTGEPPSIDVCPEDIDALLASEMTNLSAHERNTLMQELRGVSFNFQSPEFPEWIDSKLRELEYHLTRPNNNRTNNVDTPNSDEQAMTLMMMMDDPIRQIAISSRYLGDPQFRLQFLRAERFDAAKASERLLQYVKVKLALFGVIDKDITMADMIVSPAERKCLESGYLQRLPSRDRAGRAMLYISPPHKTCGDPKSVLRCLFYMVQSIAQDVTAQKNGCVVVICNLSPEKIVYDRRLGWNFHKVLDALPLRFVGFHYCHDHPILRPYVSFLKFYIGREYRARFQVHEGTLEECKRKLEEFGIPPVSLPVTADGELMLYDHKEWLKSCGGGESLVASSFPSHLIPAVKAKAPAKSPMPSSLPAAPMPALAVPIPAPSMVMPTATSSLYKPTKSSAPKKRKMDGALKVNDDVVHKKKNDHNGSRQVPNGRKIFDDNCSSDDYNDMTVGVVANSGGDNDDDKNKNYNDGDSGETSCSTKITPTEYDVLLGRGAILSEHPGNLRLHQIVEDNAARYEAAGKIEKTSIANEIVQTIQEKGRFLIMNKKRGGDWVPVEDLTVTRNKVSHAFRSRRSKPHGSINSNNNNNKTSSNNKSTGSNSGSHLVSSSSISSRSGVVDRPNNSDSTLSMESQLSHINGGGKGGAIGSSSGGGGYNSLFSAKRFKY